MASKNNPKSSAELIRKHSHARYAVVNVPFGSNRVERGSISDYWLARSARDQLAHQYR